MLQPMHNYRADNKSLLTQTLTGKIGRVVDVTSASQTFALKRCPSDTNAVERKNLP